MLIEPNQTPYDLRFNLFGTPVRVHPMFWLVAVIFGWSFLEAGFAYLALWVFCVFVSILLHEFGHVWAGRLFGADGYIVLHGFGGLAVGASGLDRRWQRVIVYFAGPLIQIVAIFLPLWLWRRSLSREAWRDLSAQVRLATGILIEINLFWPLLNLAPIWPLDGGRVSREFFTWLSPRQGTRTSLVISAVAAALLAINALVGMKNGAGFLPYVPTGGLYMVLFFGLLAVESVQMMNQLQQRQPWQYEEPDDRLPWER